MGESKKTLSRVTAVVGENELSNVLNGNFSFIGYS